MNSEEKQQVNIYWDFLAPIQNDYNNNIVRTVNGGWVQVYPAIFVPPLVGIFLKMAKIGHFAFKV